MQWGGGAQEQILATFQDIVLPEVAADHVQRLLGFNEPDMKKQANMSVERAVEL